MSYVTDGRECIGFVLNRGHSGLEGFDREQRNLGVFGTVVKAANAVFNAAPNEEGAG